MLKQGNPKLPETAGGCWVCGKPPKENKRLHIDHDHRFHRAKIYITVEKNENLVPNKKIKLFKVSAFLDGVMIIEPYFFLGSKAKAKEDCKTKLKQMSVRGLLCWQDNTALQKYRDNDSRMEKAIIYLRRYKKGLNVPIS